MYLRAEKYVGGWDHMDPEAKDAYRAILEEVGMADLECEASPSLEVNVTVAYWRKANQIHDWFVRNVQGGVDECEAHEVSRDQLEDLLSLCRNMKALQGLPNEAEAVASYLPPAEGFFFGSTEIDEWYWQDIDLTIEQIERVLAHKQGEREYMRFTYHSSW